MSAARGIQATFCEFRVVPTYTEAMVQPWVFELSAFVIGLLFGSFLNVCISRLPQHQSIAKPGSRCPRCLTPIRWYDNIPLLSFVVLRGHCRSCKERIPWRYPLVELAVGLLCAFIANVFAIDMEFVTFQGRQQAILSSWLLTHPAGAYLRTIHPINLAGIAAPLYLQCAGTLIIGFLLIGLLVMDWQTHTLPNAFTLTGTAIGFLLTCVQALFLAPGQGDIHIHPRNNLRMSSPGSMAIQGDVFMTGAESLVLGRLGAIIAAAGIILLIRFLYKKIRNQEGLGLGDAKLMAMLAAFLGFWPAMLSLFVGVILCSLYAVTLLARKRATGLTRLPLGSFLCIGGLFAALFGIPIIEWYRSLL